VRVPFLILLLANILFLAWSLWVANPAASVGPVAPPAKPEGLRLASEPVAASKPGTGDASRLAVSSGASCVSLGPFLDAATLSAASARLERLGYRARTRTATEDVPMGQWVSVTGLATPEDAAHALTALRSVGIADAYVVTDSSPATTISVGVFNLPGRAEEVAEIVRQAGLEPRVTVRSRPAEVTWLDVDRRANAGLPDVSDLRDTGSDSSSPALEMRACPSGG
jgi:hypothetical protein